MYQVIYFLGDVVVVGVHVGLFVLIVTGDRCGPFYSVVVGDKLEI